MTTKLTKLIEGHEHRLLKAIVGYSSCGDSYALELATKQENKRFHKDLLAFFKKEVVQEHCDCVVHKQHTLNTRYVVPMSVLEHPFTEKAAPKNEEESKEEPNCGRCRKQEAMK